MSRRRKLQAENPNSFDGPVGNGLDSFSPIDPAGHGPMDLEIEFVVASPAEITEQSGNVGDEVGEVHDLNIYPLGVYAKQIDDAPKKDLMPQNCHMDNWVQLPTFVRYVEAHQAKTGENHAQIAMTLGVSLGTFRNWLYGQKVPGFQKKQKAARLFGCDVNEFIDNAAAERPTSVDLTTYSEIDRYRFDQAIKVLGDDRLSDDDRQMLFEELKNKAAWVLSLKSRKI